MKKIYLKKITNTDNNSRLFYLRLGFICNINCKIYIWFIKNMQKYSINIICIKYMKYTLKKINVI